MDGTTSLSTSRGAQAAGWVTVDAILLAEEYRTLFMASNGCFRVTAPVLKIAVSSLFLKSEPHEVIFLFYYYYFQLLNRIYCHPK